jgi:hypothetical protein
MDRAAKTKSLQEAAADGGAAGQGRTTATTVAEGTAAVEGTAAAEGSLGLGRGRRTPHQRPKEVEQAIAGQSWKTSAH